MCRKFLFCTLRQNTGNVLHLHLQCNCSEQCCQDFDVYVNSSVSFERLKDIHWKKSLQEKKMEDWNSAQSGGRGERELWTSCLSAFLCVFVWGDESEFPVPPPHYDSPEPGQTCSTGWEKFEVVDFKRRVGGEATSLLNFDNTNIHNRHCSAVCMRIKNKFK